MTPEAEIVAFTVPYKIPMMTTSPLNIMVSAFTDLYFMFTLVPLVFYMSYVVAREKETGMRTLLF